MNSSNPITFGMSEKHTQAKRRDILFPLAVEVKIRFSDWRYYKTGIIHKEISAGRSYYRFVYYLKGKEQWRDLPTVNPPSILIAETGEEWRY